MMKTRHPRLQAPCSCWIKKIRRGMVLEFDDGGIEIVVTTGHVGKSDSRPDQKGRYYISTEDRMVIFWPMEPMPRILGFAGKRDMKRINRITELCKADRQQKKARLKRFYQKYKERAV